MTNMNTLVVVMLILWFSNTEAKIYTKCGLTTELLNKGFSRSLVGNWVCLIESESGKDTSKVTIKANGSKNLGLFQINSKDWCKFGNPGGKCNMKCENLLNENIQDDSVCARKVQAERGFKIWKGWIRSCYGRSYPDQIANTCIPPPNSLKRSFIELFDLP